MSAVRLSVATRRLVRPAVYTTVLVGAVLAVYFATRREGSAALVEAAEAEGHDQQRIVLSDGTFIVPQSLADAATLPEGTDEADAELAAVAVSEGQDGQKPPAKSTGEAGINSPQLTPGGSTEEERAAEAEKRAPAKKAPAKKAPAKKAPAKKTAG